jgi:hypothetical protein
LDPVFELAFMGGLPRIDVEVERSSPREAVFLEIRQRVMPVNRWIAHPEQIEIGAFQDVDARQWSPPWTIALLYHGADAEREGRAVRPSPLGDDNQPLPGRWRWP